MPEQDRHKNRRRKQRTIACIPAAIARAVDRGNDPVKDHQQNHRPKRRNPAAGRIALRIISLRRAGPAGIAAVYRVHLRKEAGERCVVIAVHISVIECAVKRRFHTLVRNDLRTAQNEIKFITVNGKEQKHIVLSKSPVRAVVISVGFNILAVCAVHRRHGEDTGIARVPCGVISGQGVLCIRTEYSGLIADPVVAARRIRYYGLIRRSFPYRACIRVPPRHSHTINQAAHDDQRRDRKRDCAIFQKFHCPPSFVHSGVPPRKTETNLRALPQILRLRAASCRNCTGAAYPRISSSFCFSSPSMRPSSASASARRTRPSS